MHNCFNTYQFKNLVNINTLGGSQQTLLHMRFPLHWKRAVSGSSNKPYDFFWTPICLSGPRDTQEVDKAIAAFQNLENFGGAYLQTRTTLDQIGIAHTFRKYHVSYRTTFHLDTCSCESDWFKSMKRDSRSRFKKASEFLLKNNVVVENYFGSEAIESEILKSCYEIYAKISKAKHFHVNYKFEFKDFATLLTSDLWYLSTLTYEGEILGFSIIGNTMHNLDYTFAATKSKEYDVGRILILNAFRLGKRYKKNVCLGGGITEGDALENFKTRMGTKAVKFSNIKLVGNKLLDDIGNDNFINLEMQKWPNV